MAREEADGIMRYLNFKAILLVSPLTVWNRLCGAKMLAHNNTSPQCWRPSLRAMFLVPVWISGINLLRCSPSITPNLLQSFIGSGPLSATSGPLRVIGTLGLFQVIISTLGFWFFSRAVPKSSRSPCSQIALTISGVPLAQITQGGE